MMIIIMIRCMTTCNNFSNSRAVIDALADVYDKVAMGMSGEALCIDFMRIPYWIVGFDVDVFTEVCMITVLVTVFAS